MSRFTKQSLLILLMAALLIDGVLLVENYRTFSKDSQHMRQVAVAQSVREAASFVRPSDLNVMNANAQAVVFKRLFNALQSPELVRVKIWDLHHGVIWSDDAAVIGQTFPDNPELDQAYTGDVAGSVESTKDEHISERQFTQLLETYVPFHDAAGKVVGVIEAYVSYIPVQQSIARLFADYAKQLLGITAAAYAGVAVLLILVGRTRRFGTP